MSKSQMTSKTQLQTKIEQLEQELGSFKVDANRDRCDSFKYNTHPIQKTTMKHFDYYSTPATPYPKKSLYATAYVYDKGELIYTGVGDSGPISSVKLKEKFPGAVVQYVTNGEAYKEHRAQYYSELEALHNEFRDDLFEYYGVSDNPKRFTCYAIAYEHAHSGDLSEVHGYFGDLVELIK